MDLKDKMFQEMQDKQNAKIVFGASKNGTILRAI